MFKLNKGMPEFPYNKYENKKKVASLIHRYIHRDYLLIQTFLKGITDLDSLLYSNETRSKINTELLCITGEETKDLCNYLSDSDLTRKNVYRFFLKGSNALEIIMYHIELLHSDILSEFPSIFYSDWDTSIIINPNLPKDQFDIIFKTLVPIIQMQLITLSRKIADTEAFFDRMKLGLLTAREFIDVDPTYEQYRNYPIVFMKEKNQLLQIHDSSKNNPDIQEYIRSLGLSGNGLYVTSNMRGGVHPSNITSYPSFYLGRIMLSIKAARDAWLPVEMLDISMNYQNDDLHFAWESHSEYHIQVGTTDFRVISPTSLYFDLKKCLLDAEKSSNKTRRNKIPARIERIQRVLDTMIVPYSNTNIIMKHNLERHLKSQTLVGDIRRQMNLTRKNRN